MNYILKQFDEPLVKFSATTDTSEPEIQILWTNEEKAALLPLDLTLTPDGLSRWLRRRTIPKNRAYVHSLLAKCGLNLNRPLSIISVCKGLSLNDCYWVVEDGDTASFGKVNLYDNPFSNVLAELAFTGYGSSVRTSLLSSPEFTTDGMRFHEPVTIDGQTMQNFVWKNELISFVCTDEGATGVKLAGVYTAGYQSYDYYPGTYQMDFYRLNDETGQLEVASQEVRLLKNEDGKSYWLKGLEYDILVMYDKPRGGLSVSPQLLEKVQGGYVYLAMWDVMNDYVLRNKSIGLISYATTNGIYLVDNGVWMGEVSGFIFGVYNSQEEDAAFIGYTDAVASIRLVKKTIEE